MPEKNQVRIQKIIAERGLASRREAERWIEEGRIVVNGEPAHLGMKCDPGKDRIEVDGRVITRQRPPKVVVAMNKPKGYVCTNDDPHAERTVFDLLPPELAKLRLFCVGRLDKESEGLLLLTNDGALKNRLAHPSYNVLKRYHVDIDKPLRQDDISKLKKGIRWEGEHLSIEGIRPRHAKAVSDAWKQLEVTMHHGKKREIRRLFYAFGYDVKRLKRVQIGQFPLKGLPRGHIRTLLKNEIRQLFEVGQ